MANAITKKTEDKGVPELKGTPTFILPDKRVRIRPVLRQSAPFIKSQDKNIERSERIMLTGTSRSIICPTDSSGRYVNPFTEVERLWLEERLGINLDINVPKDNYLDKARITISKQTDDINSAYAELDLFNPYGFILYKIACISPEVSNIKKDMYSVEELFYIEDADVSESQLKDENDNEDYCYEYILSIKGQKHKLSQLLKTYSMTYKLGRVIPKDASDEWLYNELKQLIKDKKARPKFHEVVRIAREDPATYELKLFIQDAVDCGEIIYSGGEYKLGVSNTPLGKTLVEVEYYFKNINNQMTKERIKQQIELQKK
jgi:hypothetical protein